jgi:hypothetical protein
MMSLRVVASSRHQNTEKRPRYGAIRAAWWRILTKYVAAYGVALIVSGTRPSRLKRMSLGGRVASQSLPSAS